MELIYLYIKQCENVFENVEFNFSSNYIATMKNNELLVKENQNTVKNYYGNNVNSVSMFLGKNGMGKSTLLDILGMNREDRSNCRLPRLLTQQGLTTIERVDDAG